VPDNVIGLDRGTTPWVYVGNGVASEKGVRAIQMARIETRERAENPAQFAENTKNLGLGRIPHQATATNPALHDVDAVRDHVKDAWRAGLNALGDPHPLIVLAVQLRRRRDCSGRAL
jgi:hypothetical protein